MSLPDIRITDASGANFLDFVPGNDTGANLLDLTAVDWLRVGSDIGARYDLSIVAGSINVGTKAANLRVRARNTLSSLISSVTNPNAYTAAGTEKIYPILLDGSTVYDNYPLRDVRLKFKDVAVVGTVDTWTAHVTIGDYLGAFADGNPSAPTPGDPVFGPVRLGAKNTSGTLKSGVTIQTQYPKIVYWPKTIPGGLDYARVDTLDPLEKEDVGTGRTLPYKGTFANLNGGTNRIDYKIDGAIITTVRDLEASPTTTSDSQQLLRNHRYRIESGGLNGTEVKISAAAANANTHNITIWNVVAGPAAPDHSGSYDVDEFTGADVVLGNEAPAALVNFWWQVSANIGSGEKNPYPVGFRTRWLSTGVSGIEDP